MLNDARPLEPEVVCCSPGHVEQWGVHLVVHQAAPLSRKYGVLGYGCAHGKRLVQEVDREFAALFSVRAMLDIFSVALNQYKPLRGGKQRRFSPWGIDVKRCLDVLLNDVELRKVLCSLLLPFLETGSAGIGVANRAGLRRTTSSLSILRETVNAGRGEYKRSEKRGSGEAHVDGLDWFVERGWGRMFNSMAYSERFYLAFKHFESCLLWS